MHYFGVSLEPPGRHRLATNLGHASIWGIRVIFQTICITQLDRSGHTNKEIPVSPLLGIHLVLWAHSLTAEVHCPPHVASINFLIQSHC